MVISPSRIRNNKDNRDPRMGTSSLATPGHNRTNDDLSRNITSLLENLLKDYDSNHHPGYESGSLLLSKDDKTVTSIWPSAQSSLIHFFLLNWNNNSVFYWKKKWKWCRFTNGGQEQHSSTLYGSFLGTSDGNLYALMLADASILIHWWNAILLWQDYSMDCYFRQVIQYIILFPIQEDRRNSNMTIAFYQKSWQDSRLAFNGPIETLSLSIKMLEGIWKPDTFIYNGKKSYLHTITTPNKLLRINKDGSILYSVRLVAADSAEKLMHDRDLMSSFLSLADRSIVDWSALDWRSRRNARWTYESFRWITNPVRW